MKAFPFRSAAVCLVLLLLHACSKINHDHEVSPAYRPSSEGAEQFVSELKGGRVAVFPSLIRTLQGTFYSEPSQRQIVSLLNANAITTAVAASANLEVQALVHQSQWEIFKADMRAIAESLETGEHGANYSLVMEFVLPPGNLQVFGIHCYVFDRQGNNVFSFLLNSHHRLFSDADLKAADASEASRARLVEKATRVGVTALIQQVQAVQRDDTRSRQGYSIVSQKLAAFEQKVARIFVITRLDQQLIPVFMHSFKHSLVSGFESNGVEAAFKYLPRESGDYAKFDSDVNSFSADAVMRIDLDPLYREAGDGRPAVVGTDFAVSVIDQATGEMVWQASGKVDYINDSFLNRGNYVAHEGIRKEFAWHTTAAIVRTFTLDVNGHESAPIYTVTEDREIYQQRTD